VQGRVPSEFRLAGRIEESAARAMWQHVAQINYHPPSDLLCKYGGEQDSAYEHKYKNEKVHFAVGFFLYKNEYLLTFMSF